MPLYTSPSTYGNLSVRGGSIEWSSRGSLEFPREILDQLTYLLEMSPSMNISKPDREWLSRQKKGVTKLDSHLRLSKNLIKQMADRVDGHVHPARTARLCSWHSLLNPSLVRRLMLLVGLELTQRTDRYRTYRNCIVSDCVGAWVDRVDAVTVLWIGSAAFFALFGYDQPISTAQPIKCKCEACVLAIVGGRPQLLADLRASMSVRMKKYPQHGRVEPELWRVVDSWISHFEDEIAEGIVKASEVLAGEIAAVNKCIVESNPKPEAGLWRGLQPRRSSSKDEKEELAEPQRTVKADVRVPQTKQQTVRLVEPTRAPPPIPSFKREVPDYAYEASHKDSDTTKPVSTESAKPELARFEFEEADESFNWLDKKMQSRGLTPEQSMEMMDQVHPAFSDCAPLVPSKTGQNMSRSSNRKSSGKASRKNSPRSSWATMMVNSDDEGSDNNQTFQMEWPKHDQYQYMTGIPEMESDHERPKGPEKVDEASSYVPARRDWKQRGDASQALSMSTAREVRPAAVTSSSRSVRHDRAAVPRRISSSSRIPRPAVRRPVFADSTPAASQPKTETNIRRMPSVAASSVYSSHPGFRRSVAERSSIAPPMPEIPPGWF